MEFVYRAQIFSFIFFLWSILEFLGKILKKNIFPFVHIEHNSKSTSYLVMACLYMSRDIED